MEALLTILTIGHSTRTFPEFVEIMKVYNVTMVVDVRSVPRCDGHMHGSFGVH